MKRIKLVCGIVGDNFAYQPGDEIDWDATEADRFIAKGIARPIETAALTPGQQAAERTNKRS